MIKIFRIKSVRWPRTKTKWALSKPIIWVHFILREFIRAHNTFNVVKPSRVINVNLSFFLGTKPFFVPAWILFRLKSAWSRFVNREKYRDRYGTKSEFYIWPIPFMADKHHTGTLPVVHVRYKTIKHEYRCIRCECSNLSWFSEYFEFFQNIFSEYFLGIFSIFWIFGFRTSIR